VQKGKKATLNRRGCLWFAAGLVLAMMSGILIFITVQRVARAPVAIEEPPRVPVVVAARDIGLHTVLGPGDVTVREVPPEMVPDGAYADPDQMLGLLTTADMARGEIILEQRLITPDYVGPRAAFVMDPRHVLIALPSHDLLTSLGVIRPGDRVDIMFTLDFGKVEAGIEASVNTLMVLQDQMVAAVISGEGEQPQGSSPLPPSVGSDNTRAILLAVDPQDALVIKYFRDQGAAQDLTLRSPVAEGVFDVVPVDGHYLLQRFNIRWKPEEQR
jgi:pilus assembly protein CpaB